MSKVKIQGHASGTGILTVTAPNTSTDRTITLPDSTGTLLTADGDGSSLTGVGVDGISSSADATAITIDSSENVGIGETTPIRKLVIAGSSGNNSNMLIHMDADTAGGECGIEFKADSTNDDRRIKAAIKYRRDDPGTRGTGNLHFCVNGDNSDVNVSTSHSRMMLNTDGLHFNGDTAAANALNDYEEGTWTPTISGNSSCSMGTIHNSHYTKIGSVVTLYTTFQVTSSAVPATGALVFGGFPFAFKTLGEASFLISVYYNYRETPMAFVNANGNVYYQNTTVGGNNLENLTTGLDANTQFAFNFSYLTDA